MLVGLVACCGKKSSTPTHAERLYRSPLFTMSRAYVLRRTPAWAILSAKHGLVTPGQIVAPYDVTLGNMARAERAEWGVLVRAQIDLAWPGATFLVLAGELYRAPLEGLPLVVPMAGLGIGQQLGFLHADKGPT